jgi:5,10-methylenetetrahydrofolate reductase
MVETFTSPAECLIAVEAVRSVSSLPIVASLTFADEWSPRMGRDRWADIARIAETGVQAVGTNCSMGPSQVLEFLEEGEPPIGCAMSVQPNVGVPEKRGGRFIYPRASPDYFAYFARESVRLGTRIVGGCCGTEPYHIAAVGSIASTAQPRVRGESSRPVEVRGPEMPVAREGDVSEFARKLDEREFVNVVQLDPPKGSNTELALSAVDRFLESGRVDAVDVNSNPMARLHMDSLWLSMEIERRGMETIPHITPRDASLMGLEGNLLGAWKSGVRNVLVITGDPSQAGDYPGASDVYQTDSVGLVQVVSELNRGFDWTGNAIGDPPAFTIGVAVNPNADDVGKEADRLKRKVDQGAHFAMTQVFFEWGCWERFLEHFGGSLPIPALIAVWPLTSYRLALRLHNEVPGIVISKEVQDRLEKAEKGARAEGFHLAREIYAEAKKRAEGVYIIAPFKSPVAALEIMGG